jgi:hypothetical protein
MEPTHKPHPLAVETFPYKNLFIEVEVYQDASNSQFYPWPYVRRVHIHSDTKKRFFLSPSEFPTKEDAINAAVAEGKKQIDGGFNIDSV